MDETTLVIETFNCQVMLTPGGFYVQCTQCPYVSEYTPSKPVARRWAEAHDNDQSGDHRAS